MKKLLFILTLFSMSNIYAQSNIKVNEKAPNINITDWIENVPEDKDLENKYIVLEFWATWCGPCIAAVPHMNDIQKAFTQEDLYYISITDESIAKVERSLKRIEFKSIVVTDVSGQTQINFGDGVKGLEVFPLTVLIDKKGIIKWVGEPKSLNAKIMSGFLSDTTTLSRDYEAADAVIQSEPKEKLNLQELVANNEIHYYFDIQKSSSAGAFKAIGKGLVMLNSYSLKDMYNEIFEIKNYQLEVPESVDSIRFDIMYKNTEEPDDLNYFEKEILSNLNLIKQTKLNPAKINVVTIQDPSLLEETLENSFSSKSYADDKILFTAYTINETLNELSSLFEVVFQYNGSDETKYDFIVDINSEDDIINAIKTYGLKVEKKEGEIEYITISSKE